MRSLLWTWLVLLLGVGLTYGADSIRSTVSLHTGVTGAVPGETVPLALQIDVPEGWYTYAADPGDAGMPPDIRVIRPEGMELAEWRFPTYETIKDAAGTYFGYKHSVVLLSGVQVPDKVRGEAFAVDLDVVWMICKDMCLPFRSKLELRLPWKTEADREPTDGWQDLLVSGGWDSEETGVDTPEAEE